MPDSLCGAVAVWCASLCTEEVGSERQVLAAVLAFRKINSSPATEEGGMACCPCSFVLSFHRTSFSPLLSECARQFLAGQPPGAHGVLAAPSCLVLAANCPTDAGTRRADGNCRHLATVSHGERGKDLQCACSACPEQVDSRGGLHILKFVNL